MRVEYVPCVAYAFPQVDDFQCLLFHVVSRFLSLSLRLLSTIQSIAFRDTIRNASLPSFFHFPFFHSGVSRAEARANRRVD